MGLLQKINLFVEECDYHKSFLMLCSNAKVLVIKVCDSNGKIAVFQKKRSKNPKLFDLYLAL